MTVISRARDITNTQPEEGRYDEGLHKTEEIDRYKTEVQGFDITQVYAEDFGNCF